MYQYGRITSYKTPIMEKYSTEQLKTEKIAVKCNTSEEAKMLWNAIKRDPPTSTIPAYMNIFDDIYTYGTGWNPTSDFYEKYGYKIIEYNQIDFMKKEEKKIIGYKAKNNTFLEASKIITNNSLAELRNGVNFEENSTAFGKLKEAGVLDIWFDVIYESTKKEITIGNNCIKLVIDGDNISGRVTTNYQEVKGLYNSIMSRDIKIARNSSVGGHVCRLSKTMRSIRIGCVEENNLFSIHEIESILKLCESYGK